MLISVSWGPGRSQPLPWWDVATVLAVVSSGMATDCRLAVCFGPAAVERTVVGSWVVTTCLVSERRRIF